MRFNERQLIYLSLEKADFEGSLHYKKVLTNFQNSKGFKERWFKLRSNILFYFKLNDTRQLCSKQPSGLFILEDSNVQIEEISEAPFAFSITFRDDVDRRCLFAGRSQKDIHDWMSALKVATCGHLKNRLIFLQEKIKAKCEEQKTYEESISDLRPITSSLQPAPKLESQRDMSSLSSTMNLIEF